MKDSVERIVQEGNSSLLFSMASKIKNIPIEYSKPMLFSEEANVYVMTEVAKREGEKVINTDADLLDVDSEVKFLKVNTMACNDEDITELELSVYKNLKELIVGKNALQYVVGLELKGLASLERVEIGAGSFSKGTDGVFEVAECEALETISIDDGCFPQCSVVLFRGECWFNASSIDLPSLKKLMLGKDVFCGDEIGETRLVMKSGFLLLC